MAGWSTNVAKDYLSANCCKLALQVIYAECLCICICRLLLYVVLSLSCNTILLCISEYSYCYVLLYIPTINIIAYVLYIGRE